MVETEVTEAEETPHTVLLGEVAKLAPAQRQQLLETLQGDRAGTDFGWLVLAFAGISAGYMVGLSQAPVIQATIATLLTALIAVASAWGNLQDPTGANFKAKASLMVGWLVIGMGLGATLGVYVRDHGLLTPQPRPEVVKAGPSNPAGGATPATPPAVVPSFLKSHAVPEGEKRDQIRAAEGVELVNALEQYGDPTVKALIHSLHGKSTFTPEEEKTLDGAKAVALGTDLEP